MEDYIGPRAQCQYSENGIGTKKSAADKFRIRSFDIFPSRASAIKGNVICHKKLFPFSENKKELRRDKFR